MPALTDSLIGNVVVLLAALIGFWGVIYSQRQLAAMAEAQRRHDEDLAKRQAISDRNAELRAFANAFLGELSALRQTIASGQTLLSAQISLAEEISRQSPQRKTQPRISFGFATPVFDSHVARIGLLPHDLTYRISNLYGQMKSFAATDQKEVPEMDAGMAAQVMRSVGQTLSKLDADIGALQALLNSEINAAGAQQA